MPSADIEASFVKPVRYAIYIVSLAIWAVVGFFFWIPVLVRTTASFSAAILYAALTGSPSRQFGQLLNAAITFYFSGFSRISDAMFASEGAGADLPPFRLMQFLSEIVWAVFFWALAAAWVFDWPLWRLFVQPFIDLAREALNSKGGA